MAANVRILKVFSLSRNGRLSYVIVLFSGLLFALYLMFATEVTSPITQVVFSSTSRPISNDSSQHVNISEESNRITTPRGTPISDDSNEIYKKYAIHTKKCHILDYNYADPTIIYKYFSNTPYTCDANAKPLVFYPRLHKDAFCIGMNDSLFENFHSSQGNFEYWNCTYSEVLRNVKHKIVDDNYVYGETTPLVIGSCPKKDYLWIQCTLPDGAIYEQPLLLPVVRPITHEARSNSLNKSPLNVLVIGLDSVSRLNAHRQFPETLKFLNTKLNLIELFGYNKVGLNSAPNQIPLLTGTSADTLKGRVGMGHFDNATYYLWDDFAMKGFRTMFYEEWPGYGLFTYPDYHGFLKAPTNYYPRPLIEATDNSYLKKSMGGGFCLGPDFATKQYMDYTYNTLKLLGKDRPLFSYSWLVELGHDSLNGGHRIDKYFHDMFKTMDDEGILNNTALFFISDHGFRFGNFRNTPLGRYEDILPYGFILMPPTYFETYPDALRYLKINSRRLVTVYDLHASLLELADVWFEDRPTSTANGLSLFSNEIPEDKTCVSGHIDFQFCSCFRDKVHKNDHPLALSLSAFSVDRLNSIIKDNGAESKCYTWKLSTIDNFVRLFEGNHPTNYFKLSITMKPQAQFDIFAEYIESKESWKLISNIDRVDWFSWKAICVRKEPYERYCYCSGWKWFFTG